MAYACPDGRLGSLLLFDGPLPQYVEPIDTRGWTLQEYILSPRLLAYGLHGLRFSCRQGVQQDDEETTERSFSARNNRKLALLRVVPENIEIARTRWSKILLEYSCRTLSHFEDRLLAISGIAKYHSDTLKDDYLAGLWHRDLPGALMWQNVSAERHPRTRSGWAPSWSWAAIKGAVHKFYEDMPIDPIIDIVSHDIQLVEPAAPFGDVLSGRIYLNARLKAALWDGNLLFSITSPHIEYLACTIEDAPEIAVTQEVMMQVCCLAIHPYDELSSKGPFWSHTGTSTVHEWTFRRLGIFSFKDNMLDPASRDAFFYSQFNSQQREWDLSSEYQSVVLV
jgi:hypothetical protein